MIIFFFSSRRRHTRLQGDWSSDVCSSDLRPLRMLLADSVPASFDVDHRRSPLTVAPQGAGEIAYAARPHHRGTFSFGDIHLRLRGPLDLVERQGRVAATAPANVYPDLHENRRYDVTLSRGIADAAAQGDLIAADLVQVRVHVRRRGAAGR